MDDTYKSTILFVQNQWLILQTSHADDHEDSTEDHEDSNKLCQGLLYSQHDWLYTHVYTNSGLTKLISRLNVPLYE